MKATYKLSLILCLFINAGERISQNNSETYVCYSESGDKMLLAKLTFTIDSILSPNHLVYYLKCYTHHGIYKVKANCYIDERVVKLYDNEFINDCPFGYKMTFQRKKCKNDCIKLHLNKNLLPCWIHLDDSVFYLNQSNKLTLNTLKDSSEITIISSKVNSECTEAFKIYKSTSLSIGIAKKNTNLRGDIRPDISKITYGVFKHDTLVFLGTNGIMFNFIKLKRHE